MRRATRSSGPTASSPVSCTPTSIPTRQAQERFKEATTAYEVLSDPQKREIVDLGGDPLSQNGARRRQPVRGGGFGGLGDIMDAFFGASSARGPRSRVRQGSDALIRLDLELAETAFGRDPGPDRGHRGRLRDLLRRRHGPRHPPGHLRHLRRPRRDPERAAVVPRPGDDQPAVPDLRRHRHRHPSPVRDVRRRRPGPGPPYAAGQGAGGRRGRDADPALRPGRGRPRRRPGRRPVRRDPRAAARHLHPRGRRPALPGRSCR